MSKPSIEDVMTAIAGLAAELRELSSKDMLQRGRHALTSDELAKTRADLLRVESNVSNAVKELAADTKRSFAEVTARFDALDEKLGTFQGVIASGREDVRDLREDVVALHKGLAQAKVPGVPPALPSEVRAKSSGKRRPAARRR